MTRTQITRWCAFTGILALAAVVACSPPDTSAPAGDGDAEGGSATGSGEAGGASGMLDAAKDAAGDAMDSAQEAAGDAMDAAGDAAGDAMDAASGVAGDAKDAARDAAGDAMDAAGDAMDAAGDAVDGMGAGDAAPAGEEENPIAYDGDSLTYGTPPEEEPLTLQVGRLEPEGPIGQRTGQGVTLYTNEDIGKLGGSLAPEDDAQAADTYDMGQQYLDSAQSSREKAAEMAVQRAQTEQIIRGLEAEIDRINRQMMALRNPLLPRTEQTDEEKAELAGKNSGERIEVLEKKKTELREKLQKEKQRLSTLAPR